MKDKLDIKTQLKIVRTVVTLHDCYISSNKPYLIAFNKYELNVVRRFLACIGLENEIVIDELTSANFDKLED